jgi:hypothetical protein
MNIFVIDQNPEVAAIHLVDRHVSKMILESSQIFSNCFTLERMSQPDCPKTKVGGSRKHSYPHHPCCIWATQSRENMRWLIRHAKAMDVERMERNGKKNPHFSMQFINWVEKNIEDSIVPEIPMTPFAQAMPEEYRNSDTIVAYRNYYKFGKKHLHQWKRNKPDWI